MVSKTSLLKTTYADKGRQVGALRPGRPFFLAQGGKFFSVFHSAGGQPVGTGGYQAGAWTNCEEVLTMYSSLIGKIEKAKRYQEEPNRARVNDLSVDFQGENDVHHITLSNGKWHCNCSFFDQGFETCSHVMTMQRLLEPMLSEEVRTHGLPSGLWQHT